MVYDMSQILCEHILWLGKTYFKLIRTPTIYVYRRYPRLKFRFPDSRVESSLHGAFEARTGLFRCGLSDSRGY